MKRLIFMGKHIVPAARILFEGDDRYTPQQYAAWPELEVTLHEDGRYAVWVNLIDDAELLRDTVRDADGRIARLAPYVDETIVD
ncbi:MAG TPA: hypothetical protein IAA32_08410 [Candidatus Butyricicoccus stercorigallinarum]|nr:hypothetical protein [Candidatus Butyricicoccus stercorigallinarum]